MKTAKVMFTAVVVLLLSVQAFAWPWQDKLPAELKQKMLAYSSAIAEYRHAEKITQFLVANYDEDCENSNTVEDLSPLLANYALNAASLFQKKVLKANAAAGDIDVYFSAHTLSSGQLKKYAKWRTKLLGKQQPPLIKVPAHCYLLPSAPKLKARNDSGLYLLCNYSTEQ